MKRLLITGIIFLYIFPLQAQQRDVTYFVNQAISNSPLLKDYQNQVHVNQIDSMRIRSGLGLQVFAESNNSYSPIVNGCGQDEAITNGTNISALVTVSKDILGQRNIRNQYMALRLQSLVTQNSGKISEKELQKNVTEQYINTFGTWQQYRFNSDVLLLLQKEKTILKKLTEEGTYKQTDYLVFLVSEQQQQMQVIQLNNQYHDNYALLNYLCGIEDTAVIQLSELNLVLTDLPELRNSVFYQQFVNDSLKLAADNKQVDFAYQPKLNVFGNGGYLSSLAVDHAKNFGVTVGLNLSVPIYDGKQRKMQHDKLAIAEQTRLSYRDFFTKQYQQQINRLLQQLQVNRQMEEQAGKQIELVQALIEANHKLLETGDASVTDYILAIGNYLSAKNALIQNAIEMNLIINQVNYWGVK